jgi:uncharacterized OsmC-like protein
MTSQIIYKGKLRTEATHVQSGTMIETDAPKDNHGLGEKFSPTDLVATALGSCMASVMGIAANTHGIDIDNMKMDIEKIMQTEPRRIAAIKITVYMPTDKTYSYKDQIILERSARSCPVLMSLHEDVEKHLKFIWE